ncbi:MAG: alpha amylase catalytic region [Acidobacteriaceae bacterium]|nr:alpha amylase catalytic region [Acidobacteriaceae bacterium]
MDLSMPNFFLYRVSLLPRRWLVVAAVLLVAVSAAPIAVAQTLARPGWVGSGLTPNVWWRHAFVYAVDVRTGEGLKGVASQMDAMQTLGVDAVLLRGLQGTGEAGIDPAAGPMEDFDAVLVAASRHSLRVLVELSPKATTEDVSGVARFWLSRGVAGFRLVAAGDSSTQMRQLRELAKNYVGERVMIGDAASAGGAGPQLLLDASIAVAPLNVAAIRTALEKNDAMNRAGGGVPMLATAEGAGGGPEFAKVVATLLLSTRGGAMIRAGQQGSDQSAAWYRQMSTMQHSNTTVRTGVNAMLNHDAENVVAWVRRPQQAVSYKNPAVVFVCNMTDKPVTVSLRPDMQGLKLKGNFMKTVLRTDEGMGGVSLDAVKVGPYGVYVGELKY